MFQTCSFIPFYVAMRQGVVMVRVIRPPWVLAALCLLLASPQAHAQSASFWWHYLMTQNGRGYTIVNSAQQHGNGSYGGQCKAWVQNVVWQASRGVVWLPQNDPSCMWRWRQSSDVRIVASDYRIYLRPGQIVQAQVRLGSGALSPHTMIVLWQNGDTISVIESNWGLNERVGRRTVSA